jgi:hypothetical protein
MRGLLCWTVCLLLLCGSGLAAAQDDSTAEDSTAEDSAAEGEQPSAEPAREPTPPATVDAVGLTQVMDVARSKAERGLALYAEKTWQDAFDNFEVANQLFHAPTLVMYMAHCQRELGKLVKARNLYKSIVNEKFPAEAPPAYHQAVDTARGELGKLSLRIPKISIEVTGVPPEDVRATLDNRPANLHPFVIDVNPGEHVIEVLGRRADPVVKRVTVKEGEVVKVDVVLTPVAPLATSPIGIELPLIFGAVGVAGLAVGAIAGAVVLGKVSDLETRCGGFSCPTALETDQRDAKPIATVSTVGFIAGGVVVAAAAVLLTVHLVGGDAELEAGPASLSFRARF